MKIAFFEIQGWEKKLLKKAFKGHTLEFLSEPLNKENVDQFKDFDVISVFIYSELEKVVLAKLKKLKMISTRSTGYDHIDIEECRKRKIAVSNVPFYGENTVAEHTFALILSLSRNVHKSYVRGLRNNFSIEGLKGFDLNGKTIGVVGGGHIGMHVIRMAKGFGMEVFVYDIQKNKFLSEVLDFQYVELEELYKKSDIISLHVPHNKSTHHMINEKAFSKMKDGVILINTSRGEIVDTDALIEALDSGKIRGAGLDVLEGEELICEEKELLYEKANDEALREIVRDRILLSKDNVVFTPHIAFYSEEALLRIIETTIDNIQSYIAGNDQMNSL